MALWEKYGLTTPGWFRSHAAEPRYAKLTRAACFRLALEEAGGLFPVFGQFLAGRADLLPSPYLYELRKIRPSQETASPPGIEGELGKQISGVETVRAAFAAGVFSAVYQDRRIVIEVYRRTSPSVLEESWDLFCRKIRRLDDDSEAAVSRTPVLEQFWEWLRVQGDIERKRNIIANLQKVSTHNVSRFPRLVPDLQSPTSLVYEAMEGAAVDKEIVSDSSGSSKSLQVLAEGILEQSLLLSLIDTELLPENYLLLPDGGLGFRSLPAWISVPVEWHYELLQYVASSAAGNTPRALQMLSRMSSGRDSYSAEQHLLSQLSSLQPELKISAVTPESVAAVENNWRALARTPVNPPLFVQLFHRNLTLLGQYCGSEAPATDPVADAIWTVLGRVIRFHLGKMLSTEKGGDWIVSSGLTFMTATRQMSLALERLRDYNGDVSAGLDYKDSELRDARLNRRTAALIRSAILLVVFLFSVQLAWNPGGGAWPFVTPFLAKSAAVAAAVALCISVASIR